VITVVDYGIGNVGSILNMLKRLGIPARLSRGPEDVASAEKLILPGIGAFDAGMAQLRERGLVDPLERRVRQDRVPVLGICLGFQLMGRGSEEGRLPGLGWLDADAVRFDSARAGVALRVPHMGWNLLRPRNGGGIVAQLPESPRFYFVHSYHLRADREEDVAGWTTYGYEFAAAMERGHMVGVQFHPEKSHKFGMSILRNFAERF
jgi:glutamine amidotransferase